MSKKKAPATKKPFISWGPGAIGQLDNDDAVDVKCEHVTFHPHLGPFEFPDIRIDDVDVNLPTAPVQKAISFVGDAILAQMPVVRKLPFIGDVVKSFTSAK